MRVKAGDPGYAWLREHLKEETQPADMDCQPGSGVENGYERYWKPKG
jgi:hypothetical protein